MNISVQVTLDLPKATDEQRNKFYEKLRTESWQKISSVTTTWKINFKEGVTPDAALEVIKQDLKDAAYHSGASFDASVSVGFEPVKIKG